MGYYLPNSFQQRIPFCLGENLVDDDNEINPAYARTVLNYSIDSARRVILRGGRAKISQKIPNVRFISPMAYTSTAIPPVREYFWGTNGGAIYKHDVNGQLLTLQSLGSATLTPGKKLRPINFNGKLLVCNGTDTELQYDGSSWSTLSTGLSERFIDWVVAKNRIYAISATRLYWCALNGETNWTAASGENDPNSRVVQTSFPTLEGDELVSVATVGDFVVVFGRNTMVVYSIDLDQRSNAPFKAIPGVGIVATRAYVNAGSLFFWSTNGGWREFLEALTGETIELEKKSPIRKNEPRLRQRLEFMRGAGLLDNIHCGVQARESRLITCYPRNTDGTGVEFYIYNFTEDVTAWFRWNNHPVFSFMVDHNGDILAGGNEYVYVLDTTPDKSGRVYDEGGPIGGTTGAIWEPPFLFGKDKREKIFHTLGLVMENRSDVNIGYEAFTDYGGRDSHPITKQTLVMPDSGYKYAETVGKPGSKYGAAVYAESGSGRREKEFGIEGAGINYKPRFRYQGNVSHRFLDVAIKGEIVV